MTTGELQQRVYLGGERLAGRALVGRGRARQLLGRGDARARRAPRWSRWSPSTSGSRATPRSGSARRCAGGSRCGRRRRCQRVTGARAAGRGGGGRRPDRDGAVRAVRHAWCSPATGSPITSWRGLAGLAMDPGTRGPAVDTTLATSARGRVRGRQPGARGRDRGHGRAVRPARRAAHRRASWPSRAPDHGALDHGTPVGAAGQVPVLADAAAALDLAERDRVPTAPPAARPVRAAQQAEFRRLARLEVRQDGRLLARSRPVRLIPERARAPRRGLAGPGRPRRRPGPRGHRLRGSGAGTRGWLRGGRGHRLGAGTVTGSRPGCPRVTLDLVRVSGGAGDDRARPQQRSGIGPHSCQGVAGRP